MNLKYRWISPENSIHSVQWDHSNRYDGRVCNREISDRKKTQILCLPSRPASDLWTAPLQASASHEAEMFLSAPKNI